MNPNYFSWVKFQKPPSEIQRPRDVPGFTDERLPPVLADFSSQAKTMINVGIWKGLSVAIMAQAGPPGCVVWAIDHFKGSPGERGGAHIEAAQTPLMVLAQFVGYMSALDLWGRVMPLTMDSQQAALYFPDGYADLIYIDGGHDQESAYQDISTWIHKVKPGGEIIGDDLDWPGVKGALEQGGWEYDAPIPNKMWRICVK